MWAGSLTLRIGERSDLLVGVQAEDDAVLDLLRTMLEPWLDRDRTPVRPAFGVRLDPSPDRDQRRAPRAVPQLRFGSTVIARSRRPADVLTALGQVLGGVHAHRRDDGRLWVGLRPFARDGSVVLVDARRPALVNDPALARSGVHDLPTWSVVVGGDDRVHLPPPLPGVRWDPAAVAPPPDEWRSLHLVGLATLSDDGRAADGALAGLVECSPQQRWATLVAERAGAGCLVSAPDRHSLRAHVARLLDVGGR